MRTDTEQIESLERLEEPIRIEGKDTKPFNQEVFMVRFFEEDCYLSLTFHYSEGHVESKKVISKYYEILPPSFTFRKPAQ